MREALEKIGFDPKERKNVRLIRPSDIMKIQPSVIASCFVKHLFSWGDCPPLRWATNNTKLVRSGKAEGTDTGNFYYAKIEGKSRKTDPFMALVASMAIEDSIVQIPDTLPSLDVIVGCGVWNSIKSSLLVNKVMHLLNSSGTKLTRLSSSNDRAL